MSLLKAAPSEPARPASTTLPVLLKIVSPKNSSDGQSFLHLPSRGGLGKLLSPASVSPSVRRRQEGTCLQVSRGAQAG